MLCQERVIICSGVLKEIPFQDDMLEILSLADVMKHYFNLELHIT